MTDVERKKPKFLPSEIVKVKMDGELYLGLVNTTPQPGHEGYTVLVGSKMVYIGENSIYKLD